MSAPEILLASPRFRVERFLVTDRNGQSRPRDVVRHPGAVVILPVLDDGRLCLIRNFRVAVNETLIEAPAGTLEPGEPPLETARRELIEETGYRCSTLTPLTRFFASPGFLDERLHAFLATGLTAGEAAREPGEQIENYEVTLEEALRLIREGEIKDGKTVATILFYNQFRANE